MHNKNKHAPGILHVSLEYGAATLGGLGTVVTQLTHAQNVNKLTGLTSAVITPYYPQVFAAYKDHSFVAEVEHLFHGVYVKSQIHCITLPYTTHYFVIADPRFAHVFDLPAITFLYNDCAQSDLLDRIKYFSGAVAAFLFQLNLYKMQPKVLQLHDWSNALVPRLLKDRYGITNIKSIFTVHIDSTDNGTYDYALLNGIGLRFKPGFHSLKAIGLADADRVVPVSASFMRALLLYSATDPYSVMFAMPFLLARLLRQKMVPILNGIDYQKYCPIGKQIMDPNNVYGEKLRLKQHLQQTLSNANMYWEFNPNLPLVLFIGRFTLHKGVDQFQKLITALNGRAVFWALGRGMHEDVYELMHKYNFKCNNVFISSDPEVQEQYGPTIRACADFTFVPSHNEACGLVPMEGFANGSACIASSALNDSLLRDKSYVFDLFPTREDRSLHFVVNKALTHWEQKNAEQRNAYQIDTIEQAKKFDWLAPGGAADQYNYVISKISAPG